ncbi:MAG TPA: DUF3710 domain-containing protein [Streptosporangiaceae bacterium]|nr:DUF3710 domain-containing protein [Streptosporangiaceae bacterium]
MFRRRRRDGGDGSGLAPGDVDYPAADDELTEQDYGDAGTDAADDYADEQYDDDDQYDDLEVSGYAEDEAVRADGEEDDEGQESAGRARRADLGDPATWTRLRDSAVTTPAMLRSAGPWDSAGEYPDAERIDFGSLLVPAREGFDVQVFMSEEEGISIAVVRGDSGLQLQPFAAPRSSGLWHEVLPEIADEVAKAGGQSREQDGPFGPELYAVVVPQGASEHEVPPQPLRFLGADGPRWFLRGLISGPAATDEELSRPFEDIFADVVVVRGEHAEPQRKPLDIRLPDEARQVLESQLEGEAGQAGQAGPDGQDASSLNPFERGPEITETR